VQAGIQVENLSKTYRKGNVQALKDVTLSVSPGEIFGLIGPNGAGKTTFLGCLLGLLFYDGRIRIDDCSPDDLQIRYWTGYLPERLTFDRWMTGRSFLHYHYRLARRPQERMEEEVSAVLEKVGLDDTAARRTIRKYSRGMLQRLGFAQALLGSPRYLFLDEPASGVDPLGVITFRDILQKLKQEKVTVILNSHQLEQVERVCDRVAFVKQGRVEAIEVLQAGAQMSRVLRIRWAGEFTDLSRLPEIAAEAGTELVEASSGEARFLAETDAEAARLIRTLVSRDVPVVEVTSEQSRLERLFLKDREESK